MTRLLILSGLSGSGKSTAVKSLEDIGFYCVDNLPPSLLNSFIELCSATPQVIENAALVIDVREGYFFQNSVDAINELKSGGISFEILFLDSSNETLVKRFKETRRKHPLSVDGNILEGVDKERKMLSDLMKIADYLIDTSNLNVHQLRELIQERFGIQSTQKMSLTIMSFGTSYGYPYEADIVIDARFLTNPNFIENLKCLNGNDKEVIDFVMNLDDTHVLIDKLIDLFEFLIPKYEKEGKSYLTIALGCTGGRHRSVVLANEISKRLDHYYPRVRHRDIQKI